LVTDVNNSNRFSVISSILPSALLPDNIISQHIGHLNGLTMVEGAAFQLAGQVGDAAAIRQKNERAACVSFL